MIELAPKHKYGLPIASPVMPAAGTFGYGDTYHDLVNIRALGALVTNPVSLKPRSAAKGRRLLVHGDHFITHTGLPNPGLRRVLRQYRKLWERFPIPVIVHVIATTPAETAKVTAQLAAVPGVAGVELGLVENVTPEKALGLLDAARDGGGLPVIVRVPFSHADTLAPRLAEGGADALTLTAPPRAVLPVPTTTGDYTRRFTRGRLYGPAVFPQLLNVLALLNNKLEVPIIACGGIASAQQAIDCLALGATAIQVDALLWRDPRLLTRIAEGLREIATAAPGEREA